MVEFTIKDIRLHRLEVPLKQPFSTHLQKVKVRESLVLEMIDTTGEIGLGECVAFSSPWYTEETIQSCEDVLTNWIIPAIMYRTYSHPKEVVEQLQFIKGNRMAKATIDLAVWDLFAKKNHQPLWKAIGGKEKPIEAGVVLTGAIDDSMYSRVEEAVSIGYKRVKVKLDCSTEPKALKKLVQTFPKTLFYGDANGIFHELGMQRLQLFDEVGLTLIEQPFLEDDWALHQEATRQMKTAIALDESLRSVADVERMIEKKAGDIIVLKPGRVGGITPSLIIHALAEKYQIPIWIGGMIELGISKAHNIALASLPMISLPGDFSASNHFWKADIIQPMIHIEDGHMKLSKMKGISYTLDRQQLTVYKTT